MRDEREEKEEHKDVLFIVDDVEANNPGRDWAEETIR